MINELLAALNQVQGVEFVRDLWIKEPAGDYGTVELTSERFQWADNRPHKRQQTMTVTLYVHGNGDKYSAPVMAALLGLRHLRTFSPGGAEYLDQADLTQRRWTVVMEEVI